jgi:hypothetical protein
LGFAAEFFEQVGEARAPTMAVASRLDLAAIARPWLLMGYQVIRATTPVLRYALNRTTEYEGPLAKYFAEKLRDEAGHDDMWLRDMRAAEMSEPDAAPPNPFIAEMVGRQYYLIDFVNPAAYLGYIGLLEGFQPTAEQVDAFAQASGLPSTAFRCARMHASVDVEHRENLTAALDVLPANLHHHVLDNGIRCAELHRAALIFIAKERPHHGHEQPAP